MALQNYARLKVFVDGTELTQVTSISMQTQSGNQVVNLLNEGLGGFTEGSGMVTIEIGYAVPIGGQEHKFQQKCANKEFVTIQLVQGAEQYTGVGKYDSTDISQTAGASVEGRATWMGELAAFEGGLL